MPRTRDAHTVVLALGNPLRGDDGAGAAVLAELRGLPLPADVDLVEGGTPGLETVLLLEGYRQAVLIDAAEMGLEPGAWRRFSPAEGGLDSGGLEPGGTLHSAGLGEALALGEALGVLPPRIVIFGVQPQEIGWEPGLNAPVQAAVPAVAAAIAAELAAHET